MAATTRAGEATRGWPLFLVVAAAAAAADLVSKKLAFARLGMPGEHPPLTIVPKILVLETSLNEGALFGMGQGMGAVFATVSVAAIAGILALVSRPSTRRDPWILLALGLIVGGIVLLVLERLLNKPHIHRVDDMPTSVAFKIGLVQCIAMVPGVSRSGATIMGGLLLGLDKRTAAEFSFFLAIPTMFGAVVYDLYKNWAVLTIDSWHIIAIGFVTAFISALLVVQFMLRLVTRYGFTPFAIYRIILGSVMLAFI